MPVTPPNELAIYQYNLLFHRNSLRTWFAVGGVFCVSSDHICIILLYIGGTFHIQRSNVVIAFKDKSSTNIVLKMYWYYLPLVWVIV